MGAQAIDYYEFLQISPHADADTIRRVYRFLAARLHPDNHATGHVDNFRLLKAAYDVLSDPRRRAEYDATRIDSSSQPLSTTIDFMDSLEGELNGGWRCWRFFIPGVAPAPTSRKLPLARSKNGWDSRAITWTSHLVSTEEGVYLEGRQCTIHSDRRWRGFCGEGAQQTSDPAQAADQRFRIVGRRSGTKPTKRGDCFLAESLGAWRGARPFPPANQRAFFDRGTCGRSAGGQARPPRWCARSSRQESGKTLQRAGPEIDSGVTARAIRAAIRERRCLMPSFCGKDGCAPDPATRRRG